MSPVRRARAADFPALGCALARAFHDDPFWRWMARPGPHYERRLEQAFLAQLHHLERSGGVIHTLQQDQGGALWSPPGTWGSNVVARLRHVPDLVRLCGLSGLPARLHGIRQVQALHPPTPHFYLQIIGVDPRAQQRGYARHLLDSVLTQCDSDGFPAYLETCNPHNVPLYQHFGFQVKHEFALPDQGPRVWCLWRDPIRQTAGNRLS
ncbi:GNAT family N-acetyltransferase [Isoalcanivorax indicus]|uniref:GNAT family N-acetyltransferase n=1 Tax=Isoalcanivorax indicus TaxID=2202653 RepID=UPI000DB97996|nr:GNAT family N-acetyltransferase [Isoalcanivorax indicus]